MNKFLSLLLQGIAIVAIFYIISILLNSPAILVVGIGAALGHLIYGFIIQRNIEKAQKAISQVEDAKKMMDPNVSGAEREKIFNTLQKDMAVYKTQQSDIDRKRMEWFKAEVNKLKREEITHEKLDELYRKSKEQTF